MPALNFQRQFAALILDGFKCQTIRPLRKHPINVGDTLHLFVDQRSPRCRKLLVTQCSAVWPIEIIPGAGTRVNGVCIDPSDEDSLARSDGFANGPEMVSFIRDTYGLPFKGTVIHWPRPEPQTVAGDTAHA